MVADESQESYADTVEDRGRMWFLLRNDEPARGSQMMSFTKFTSILKF